MKELNKIARSYFAVFHGNSDALIGVLADGDNLMGRLTLMLNEHFEVVPSCSIQPDFNNIKQGRIQIVALIFEDKQNNEISSIDILIEQTFCY